MNTAYFESRRYDLMVTLSAWASSNQYMPPEAMAAALERWAADFDQFKTLAPQSWDPSFEYKCDQIKWAMCTTSQWLRRERRLTREIVGSLSTISINIGRLTLG